MVAYDPGRRLDITYPAFKADDRSTWGYAADERRVFGLGVRAGRLYYAVAGEQVWSVSIAGGAFGNDARVDVQVPPWNGESEILKITFDDNGAMLLAERGVPTGAYDFVALAKEAVGRVLRYQQAAPAQAIQPSAPPAGDPPAQPVSANQPAPDAASLWQPVSDEYAIGFPADLRNDNGGIAIGGRCGHPGRHHIDVPPRHKSTRRERTVAPNWKPVHVGGLNVRLNSFHPVVRSGMGGMGAMGGIGTRYR